MYEVLIIGGLSIAACITCYFCAMAGAGSGLILVPLMILGGLTPVQAIAVHKFEALWTVVSGWRYYKKDAFIKIDFLWYLVFGMIGTFIGARYIHFIPNDILQVVVGILILTVALFIRFSKTSVESETKGYSGNKRVILICSMFVFGLYEGTFGAGNGFFIAALFFWMIGAEEHKTVGMITILAAFWNLTATATHFTFGSLLWHYALPMGGMAMLGAWFGAGHALHTNKRNIRKVIFVLSMIGGMTMLLQVLIESKIF